MRMLAWLSLACAFTATTPAVAGRFTVEDLLAGEDVGRAAFSPDGRWLVVELQAAWKSAPAFDQDFLVGESVSRIVQVDLAHRSTPRPLIEGAAGEGYTFGAFSPDGRRLIVYRQRGHARELGVVDLASGHAQWSGRWVEPEVFTAQARWRDNREVVAITREPDAPARLMGIGWRAQAQWAKAWSAQARGELSVTTLGGGRYQTLNAGPAVASLVAFDPDRQVVRPLAQGAFVDLLMSPDGRTAALLTEAERTTPDARSVIRVGYPPRRLRATLVDLASGERATPCPRCDLLRGVWAWSPDGHALAVAARPDGDGWSGYRYWRLSVDGEAKVMAPALGVGDTGGRDVAPLGQVAWTGADPLVLARPVDGGRLDWWAIGTSGPRRLTGELASASGPGALVGAGGVVMNAVEGPFRIDRAGVRRLGSGVGRLTLASASPAGQRPTAALLDVGPAARVVTSDGPGPAIAGLPTGAKVLALATASGQILSQRRDAHGVSTLTLLSPHAPPLEVARLNVHLGATTFAAPMAISHLSSGGKPVTSWLYMPAAPAAPPKGVIVVPYPGKVYDRPPVGGEPGALQFDTNIQLMSSHGYAVVVPSLPAGPLDADPMPGLADAMLLAVDAAAVSKPALKTLPLAVWGQSYGGYGALAAGVQSTRFKAVITSAPITNLLSFYGALYPPTLAAPETLSLPSELGWAEHGQGKMGGPPWSDPQRYLRNSPGLQTDRITAPVMMIYGDLDFDVNQVATVFSSLYRQGKDVQLLLYRGESHVVMSPDNVRDLYARAFAFLDEALARPPSEASPSVADSRASQ